MLLGADKKRKPVWNMEATEGQIEIFQNVWEWAEYKLTGEELNNKLLLGTANVGWAAWHMAARKCNLEILQKVWNCAEGKLTTGDLNIK